MENLIMCRKITSQRESTDFRSFASHCITALFVLAALLLPVHSARAACSTSIGDGPGVTELSAHVGDTIHFFIEAQANAFNGVVGVCRLENGTNWVMLPDGTH